MNKIKSLYNEHKGFFILVSTAIAILIIGSIISAAIFTSTILDNKLDKYALCIRSPCIQFFIEQTNSAFLVLSVTGSIIVGLITLGGIVIALSSYQNSVQTSALTNHLSHMSIFSNYVYNEIDKKSALSKPSIDVLKWYNYIYTDSRLGRTDISNGYISFISSINTQIEKSNNLYSGSTAAQYEYKSHQGSMIELMFKIGIELHRLPRLDFNEVEHQVLELIYTVNRSFCRSMEDSKFLERIYK